MGSLLSLSNYFYTFPAWPPLIVGACSLLLGIIIVVREDGSYASRTFAALCVCVSLWLITIGILYSARNPDLALWAARISTTAVAFIPSALLIFTMVIVRQFERWKWLSRLSLVLSGILSASVLCDNRVLTGLRTFPWGPYPQVSSLAIGFTVFFLALYITSLILLYQRTFGEQLLNINRDRDRQLWIAFSIGFLAIVDFVACCGIEVYPIGFLPVYTSLLILAQTIWKYRFSNMTPALAAPHIIQAMPSGLLVSDTDGQIVIGNELAATYLNRTVAELRQTTIQNLLGDLFSPAQLHQLIEQEGLRDLEVIILDGQNERRVVSFSGAMMRRSDNAAPAGFIFTMSDATRRRTAEEEREKAEKSLRRTYGELEERVEQRTVLLTEEIKKRELAEEALKTLAVTDPLTGLYNRRGFMSHAQKHMDLAGRHDRCFLVLVADLDDLKPINDTYGHQTGDTVLIQTAKLLQETFRSTDVIARIGGDEFAVGAIEEESFTEEILRERFRVALDTLNASNQVPYRVGISFGIARKQPHDSLDLEHLMAEADVSLYQQKKLKPALPKPAESAPPTN